MADLHPLDLADLRNNPDALEPRPIRDLWIAALVGAIAGGFAMLVMFAFLDSLPNAGALNGCQDFPTECAAYAAERSR